MTNEEAIKKIKSLCHDCVEFPHCVNTDPDCFKALEIAIKVLEQESCDDCISRQAVRHILNHEVKMPINIWKKLFELVDSLPSVTPKPKYKKAIEDIKAELKSKVFSEDWVDNVVYLDDCLQIIDKYKAEMSDDMSEVGVEIIKTEENEESGIKYLNINVSNDEVERNPDIVRLCADAGILEYVKPETGHWIEEKPEVYKCSNCGRYALEWGGKLKMSNCGAKMVEPQESEDEE